MGASGREPARGPSPQRRFRPEPPPPSAPRAGSRGPREPISGAGHARANPRARPRARPRALGHVRAADWPAAHLHPPPPSAAPDVTCAPHGSGSGGGSKMAGGEAEVARRIDPAREPGLSAEQRRLMERVERAQRQRALQRRLRGRNALLGLSIGALVMAPADGYTFYSVSQERFLDELEQEAERARAWARERRDAS
uniref:Cytochrome c oxidase assembly factor 3 n=1 Tax=Nothoprocta perdicaria TaxID=30464 RepID=A0A8C6YVM6_NOTPE